jgi:hypothetical protein
MKKLAILLCLFSLVLSIQAAEENTPAPQPKKAGRNVLLKRITAAVDQNGPFVFQRPHNINAIDDGSFFLIDGKKVLKFNADGGFSKTIVNKGEGPGEATFLLQLYRVNDTLMVNTGMMKKLMAFDFNGTLKWEHRRKKNVKTTSKGVISLLAVMSCLSASRMRKTII